MNGAQRVERERGENAAAERRRCGCSLNPGPRAACSAACATTHNTTIGALRATAADRSQPPPPAQSLQSAPRTVRVIENPDTTKNTIIAYIRSETETRTEAWAGVAQARCRRERRDPSDAEAAKRIAPAIEKPSQWVSRKSLPTSADARRSKMPEQG